MRIEEAVFERGKLLTEKEKGLPPGALGTGRVWRKELFEDVEHSGHIVIWTLEPGGQAPLHLEKSDEVYIVISGEMVTWNHTEEHVLTAGQASLTLSGEYHGLRNDSDDLLVVLSPNKRSCEKPQLQGRFGLSGTRLTYWSLELGNAKHTNLPRTPVSGAHYVLRG